MSIFNLLMPKMGESVQEATITKWFVAEGDKVEEEDMLLEIATDKVDSEIPSPVDGIIKKINYKENEIVKVGEVVAEIEMEGEDTLQIHEDSELQTEIPKQEEKVTPKSVEKVDNKEEKQDGRFYSPLVQSIANKENISPNELSQIHGTGLNGRLRKQDLLAYIDSRTGKTVATEQRYDSSPKSGISLNAEDEIIQMDRMRKLIADHMVMSKSVSPHVTNMLEADVTNIVKWRNAIKDDFQKREGQKITFLPIFLEAIAKALKDFPRVNVSVDGDNIIVKKRINLGIAVALPSGNLIVPVIKNADQLNVTGLTKELNRLADAARSNKLSPDDIQDGTFSISNFGSFKNVMGTPIINQPQAAILAIGTIEKKPAVIETPQGDLIGIRQKMFLSLTYDHRVIDGALGGGFLRRIADYLEEFDVNRNI